MSQVPSLHVLRGFIDASVAVIQVASAARLAAQEMIAILPKRALKVKALVDEVAGLWENPAERLSNVASTDITLMDELNGVGTYAMIGILIPPTLRSSRLSHVGVVCSTDAANQRQVDDSMSVYSAATQQSTFSRSSARSDSSRFSTKYAPVLSCLLSVQSANRFISCTHMAQVRILCGFGAF
jgi:hypothetical protein